MILLQTSKLTKLYSGTPILENVQFEVKKGEHIRSRSLSVFVDSYKPAYSIRLSLKNFGEKNGLKSVPLYAAFCI